MISNAATNLQPSWPIAINVSEASYLPEGRHSLAPSRRIYHNLSNANRSIFTSKSQPEVVVTDSSVGPHV